MKALGEESTTYDLTQPPTLLMNTDSLRYNYYRSLYTILTMGLIWLLTKNYNTNTTRETLKDKSYKKIQQKSKSLHMYIMYK